MIAVSDTDIMRVALALARRGLGRTAPNPTVGCVIVAADGKVLGQARTADGGRPHAETQALEQGEPQPRAQPLLSLWNLARIRGRPAPARAL